MAAGIFYILDRSRLFTKRYIEQATGIDQKIEEHRRLLETRQHPCQEMQADWNDHANKFTFWVAEIVPDAANLPERYIEHMGAWPAYEHVYNRP